PLQHLVLPLPLGVPGALELVTNLGERALEAPAETRGDLARGRARQPGVERVAATGDAPESRQRGVEVAPAGVAASAIGARGPGTGGGRRSRHAAAARAGLDAVAYVPVVAARDTRAGERRVNAARYGVTGILRAGVVVVAGKGRDGRADPGQAGEPGAAA